MYVLSTTKGHRLPYNVTFLTSFLSQARGLCFRKKMDSFAYFFHFGKPVRYSIHMFFVFFPIDIVFLDETNHIREIKENLKPFQVYRPKKKYSSFIELPSKTIKKHNLLPGTQLEIQKTQ